MLRQVRQVFERFDVPASSPVEAADARFEFFRSTVWPRLKESSACGLLIFVPHYFDFVRLRNFLDEQVCAVLWLFQLHLRAVLGGCTMPAGIAACALLMDMPLKSQDK